MNPRTEVLLVAAVTLLALLLRVVGHERSPLGWRDDEMSNALVVSQHVLEGEVRLYYDDASGHEGLYHWLQAGTMAAFGPGVWGIRGVSILAGTLAVTLTYALTRRLYDAPTALIASVALAVSFWGLMYSRSGQRHVLVTVTTLAAFLAFWRAVPTTEDECADLRLFALAGAFMGIGFYTYFASRGVPLIPIAWAGYLLLWKPDWLRSVWRGLLVMLGAAALFAAPLIVTLQQQPEAEARVAELAKPIYDARDGDFSTLVDYTITTLSMFTHDGDDEVLYNMPHRPVFGVAGAVLFWAGVIIALVQALGPQRDARSAFLLLWVGAGLAPGVLSVPAASLGHTILAQTPAMIFPALALREGAHWLAEHRPTVDARSAMAGLALLFLLWEGVRGPYDYWVRWPQDDFNRVLHHSDLHEAALWLRDHADSPHIAIGGFLAERWDQQAMLLSLGEGDWQVRAFDPRSGGVSMADGGHLIIPAFLSPTGTALLEAQAAAAPAEPLTTFNNGLALVDFSTSDSANSVTVRTEWTVAEPLMLPPDPLLSKPPAPDEDDTPRLRVFTQILTPEGEFVVGTDLLSVDPYTLREGDYFWQEVRIDVSDLPPGEYILVTGLYDPATGQRILTTAGDDRVELWSITR